MSQQDAKFESWAVVEVMGHKRFAGYVTEQTFGSASMLRIDVPEVEGMAGFSKLIGIGSIYAITPCTEETARAMQASAKARAFQLFELPQLPAPARYGDDDFDDDQLG